MEMKKEGDGGLDVPRVPCGPRLFSANAHHACHHHDTTPLKKDVTSLEFITCSQHQCRLFMSHLMAVI